MNYEYRYKGAYRYCRCPNGRREHPFAIHHVALGADICTHCGGIIRPKDEDEKEFDSYAYYCRQAKTCSIKEDHSTAIKFYKEVLKSAPRKWDVFFAIAGEYEAMGDFASAETYWNKCREIEDGGGIYEGPRYITERGNFLYRRNRLEEAAEAYEKALEILKSAEDNRMGPDNLKICARVVHQITNLWFKRICPFKSAEQY